MTGKCSCGKTSLSIGGPSGSWAEITCPKCKTNAKAEVPKSGG